MQVLVATIREYQSPLLHMRHCSESRSWFKEMGENVSDTNQTSCN